MLLGGEQGNGRDAGPVAGVKEESASDSEGMSEMKSRPPLMKNDQLGVVYGGMPEGVGTEEE